MNFSRLFYTIKSLKGKQIFYQIWYRIKFWRYQLDRYTEFLDHRIERLNFSIDYKSLSFEKTLTIHNNTFTFLSLEHEFDDKIDWTISRHGKLWNYNLQYLEFIIDERIEFSYRFKLINSISASLLSKDLKPEPYPASLRINNLILFDGIYGLGNPNVYQSLKLQIGFLKNNLEYHLLANHLLENYISLFIASYALKDKKLNDFVSKRLVAEINEQILKDGGHYERSPMYHSIILERLLLCVDVIKSNSYFDNGELMTILTDTCSKMLGWLKSFAFSDGSWSLMNDAAIGVCLSTHTLKQIGSKLNIESSYSDLRDSGYRKLKSNDFEVLVNVGEISPKYQPGHSHSDILSFCLWSDNEQLIVDTGVSTYDSGRVRNRERSTYSHNTISLNEKNQSDVWGGFRVGQKANIRINTDTQRVLSAEVCNMFSSNYRARHKRTLSLFDSELIVTDEVIAFSGKKTNCFHFNYSLNPQLNDGVVYFGNFQLKYEQGLRELILLPYQQALSFNILKSAVKVVAIVDDNSVFKISRIK